jgi:hypothetical protein
METIRKSIHPVNKAAIVAVLVLFALFVWPTAWRYDVLKQGNWTLPIRTHRVTGQAQIFLSDRGWQALTQDH